MLSEAERAAILEREVQAWVGRGYLIRDRTPTAAQLVKPNRMGCAELFFGVITLGILLLVFLLQKESSVYITVDELGTARVLKDGRPAETLADQVGRFLARGQCPRCGAMTMQGGAVACSRCGWSATPPETG